MIFKNDVERAIALVYLAIAAVLSGVEVLAYALMSNHFHFIGSSTVDFPENYPCISRVMDDRAY